MKVLIVSPCVNLPVPDVKGGAVSTLIEEIVRENEEQQKMELTVLSIYDVEAEVKSKNYSNTKFCYIKCPAFLNYLDACIDKCDTTIRNSSKRHQYFRKWNTLRFISAYLRNNQFDKVIFQNSGYLLDVLRNKSVRDAYNGKLYYHLHNDIPDNVYVPGVQECKILIISEYLKKKINLVCGNTIELEYNVVKNGFNCDAFDQELSESEKYSMLTHLGIDKSKKIVLYTGRINRNKGIGLLIDAFNELDAKDAVLLIVGSPNFGTGEDSAFQIELKSSISANSDKILFTGFVPYEEMWKYYKLADVAVLPSIWEEPAGLTMLEACAAGTPLITTQSGGIPEYIPAEYCIMLHRDNSLVENIKSGIRNVFDDPLVWKEKANLAKNYVKSRYDSKTFYDSFVNSLS